MENETRSLTENEMQPQVRVHQLDSPDVRAIQAAFITKVYGWMTLALTITGLIALYTAQSEFMLSLIFGNRLVFFGLIIAELGLVAWMSGLVGKASAATSTLLFVIYSVLNGLTLSVIFMMYTAASIGMTFFITAGTFAIMSAIGYFTKTDLSRLGNLLFMFLIGLIVASIVNYFMQSETLYWLISYIGVGIFVGLIAYDTQRLKEMALGIHGDQELEQKSAVIGALALYLDFVNLFLFLLRIFGRRD